MEDFITRLKDEISYSGIRRKELADKAGIKLQRLDNYLYPPTSMPPADVAVKLAKALGVTVEYLVTGEDPQISIPKEDFQMIRKYKTLCTDFDMLPKELANTLRTVIGMEAFTELHRKLKKGGGN